MSKDKNSNATGTSIDIGELMKFINDLCGQFSRLSGQINDFTEKKESEIVLLNDAMREVSVKWNFYEQRELKSMMDIDGLRFDENKNYKNSVINYITSLGIDIAHSDIIDVFVYTKRQKNNERKVLRVTFLHEFIKRRVMREKIRLHKDKPTTTVFFSHVLTRSNVAMLMEAKKLKREKRISDVKFLNNQLFAFPLCNGNKIPLACMHDLSQFDDEIPSTPCDDPRSPQENSLIVDDKQVDVATTKVKKVKKVKAADKTIVDSTPSTSEHVSKESEKSSEGMKTRSKTKKASLEGGG